jgi:D-arabinose 1-dehydrogenase-like Zn-dependent alcohol dehydrogenase
MFDVIADELSRRTTLRVHRTASARRGSTASSTCRSTTEAPDDGDDDGLGGHPAGRTNRRPRDPDGGCRRTGRQPGRIGVEAFCLDFNDIDTIRGRYGLLKFEPPFVVGMAAAGTVDAAGPGCEALLGRRVVGTTAGVQGAYASAACSMERHSSSSPPWLSAAEGVAMYFPYLVSYLALRVRGRVAPGDVVLVHAAAGGVGSAAVQLAKAFGATVIGTAGTEAKVDFCRRSAPTTA